MEDKKTGNKKIAAKLGPRMIFETINVNSQAHQCAGGGPGEGEDVTVRFLRDWGARVLVLSLSGSHMGRGVIAGASDEGGCEEGHPHPPYQSHHDPHPVNGFCRIHLILGTSLPHAMLDSERYFGIL